MATEQEYTTVLKSEQRGYKHQKQVFPQTELVSTGRKCL